MNSVVLTGIDGSNPLAFLAGIGAFRLASLIWSKERIGMRWVRHDGWRPEIVGIPTVSQRDFCEALQASGCWAPLEFFAPMGNDLTVPAETFAGLPERASEEGGSGNRGAADFCAAFACEVISDPKKDRLEYTDLCFITGSGHQHFLGTARTLGAACTADHLAEALFGPWRKADKGSSFRWDPDDAKEYALMYNNPGPAGVLSVWGANRLAFEGLPLLPAIPTRRGLQTTGFQKRKRVEEFTWPIWTQWASLDTVRSLLSLAEMQEDAPSRADLGARGMVELFRSQRVRIGQGANFKVSFRPARSV